MKPLLQFQKRTMAIAGMVMAVYLIFHMLSNLSFFSESAFNHFYAVYNGILRWLVLSIMLVAIWVHITAAIRIRLVNAKARVVDYARHDTLKIPTPLVTLSIIFLLFFIIVHIVQTLLFDTANLYNDVVQLFQSWWMVLFYLAGLLVLTMHLQHSLANVLQTLGKTSATCNGLVWFGTLLLTGGFALIPLYIVFVLP